MRTKRLFRALLSSKVKPHVILGGPLRGARMVTSWHDYPAGILGRTERPLLDWLQREVRAGETWLDIGAHYGYTAIALAKLVGPKGRVFAFEPVTATAGCVARTRQINDLRQLTVLPFGLGAPESLTNVALPLTRGMADSTVERADAPWIETLQVARLDWLWPIVNGGTDVVHGAKIDVQGMEADVVRGMTQLLARHRPKLVIEFHRGVDRASILDLLATFGYSRTPVPIETQTGDLSELRDDHSYGFVRATA